MSRGIRDAPDRRTGRQNRNAYRCDDDQRSRMPGEFQRHKLISHRDGIPAARVGVPGGSAFPLQTAIRLVAARCADREAFKRPEKQEHHHQADRDVECSSHSAQSSTGCSPALIGRPLRRRSRAGLAALAGTLWPHAQSIQNGQRYAPRSASASQDLYDNVLFKRRQTDPACDKIEDSRTKSLERT